MKIFNRGYSKIDEASVPFAKDAKRLEKEQKTAEAAKDKIQAPKVEKRSRNNYEKVDNFADLKPTIANAIRKARTYGTFGN